MSYEYEDEYDNDCAWMKLIHQWNTLFDQKKLVVFFFRDHLKCCFDTVIIKLLFSAIFNHLSFLESDEVANHISFGMFSDNCVCDLFIIHSE